MSGILLTYRYLKTKQQNKSERGKRQLKKEKNEKTKRIKKLY